jgi:hypothetical protein
MLRFGFMDKTAGPPQAMRFLKSLAKELATYIPTLRKFLKVQGASMPLSGRLALESGTRAYETLLDWAKKSQMAYKKKKKRGTRR